jgi:hypothetical protein
MTSIVPPSGIGKARNAGRVAEQVPLQRLRGLHDGAVRRRLRAHPRQLLLAAQAQSAGEHGDADPEGDAEQAEELGDERLRRVLLVVDAQQGRDEQGHEPIAGRRPSAEDGGRSQGRDDHEAEHLLLATDDEIDQREERQDHRRQGMHPCGPGHAPLLVRASVGRNAP